MKKIVYIVFGFLAGLLILNGCEEFLGSKGDATTDEIFEEGRKDPTAEVEEVAYAALVPFWEGFDNPTDVYVGFDELVYVTDAIGLHVLDQAGRLYDTIEIKGGATSVTQDRLLNIYVTARYDTVITSDPANVDPTVTWNLSAIYKIKNANGAGPVQFVDTLVQPFMDRSRQTTKHLRLSRTRTDNEELVEITGVGVLANNDIYVSRKGPRNSGSAPDNSVLIFTENQNTGKMRNTGSVPSNALHPTTPSYRSGIDINDVITLVGPPQRPSMNSAIHFLVAQGGTQKDIPFRVLWINVVETIDGIDYRPNSQLYVNPDDTSRAESFLYDEYKFKNPTGLAYSADARGHIFVVDAATDSLYLFQSNGFEGINPPAGFSEDKAINVSFGGTGNGPRQFNNPNGVAYFNEIVYVADTGNNRIARYKLSTDFE